MIRLVVLSVGVCLAIVTPPSGMGQAVAATDGPDGLSSTDWSGIREAYEAGRYMAQPVEGGWRARNPGQNWQTHFDGRGFTTAPEAGGWTWGLELLRYGFVGKQRNVDSPVRRSAEGQRLAYDWDDTLTEWYVNDTRGLEHGYTIHQRPSQAGEEGLLTFTLSVRGELAPEVTNDGLGVRFLNGDGATVLTYAGLKVFDHDGHILPAQLDCVPEGLLLTVDERGARYPLTVDPVAQQAYLKASNADAGDEFGYAVAASFSLSGDGISVEWEYDGTQWLVI